ncbi:ferritin [Pyxidicoccus sp. MSG2]|uniref:ferritin family protein n=1 Tax=Pyxidicoccus sp. MSG2 TaxID=2996790 RepID=UPI00226E4085|nr:ferritin [Pyxidicoccus sp. MSG2]MCY1023691.1 ferritin [Pyxidicoccus sp. MSG2]
MAGTPDSDLDDVARIRRVLARELETINEYEAFARASSSPDVRAFFQHLAAEEKEHVSEAVHMLRLLDSGQDAHFTSPVATGHFEGTAAGAPAAPAAPARAAPPAPAAVSGRNGRPPLEPLTSLPPQRLMYGLPAPPPAVESHPLTVGSLRRGGGGGGNGR